MAEWDESNESDVYLASVRRALANGNAAVMIGAGFSRNAEGGDQLGTWSDLAAELAVALDPNAKPNQFSVASVTQLAEQYARVFSQPALEQLLKRMVPDDQVAPGTLHTELLELPWSEILTTNYDTLLERAADRIVKRAHFTVCCREDIPQSKILGRRRIVKLHGSFPSQRPFIFTEEHYRTYPNDFAPFVNLVRQSLLENVFCLIGFSGDDPNFLHWIGWVRDMLDKYSLPVYLFLDKSPSLGQRKLLEARGVTPVLLPSSKTNDPKDFSGRYAALFNILAKPLEEPAEDWGTIAWPASANNVVDEVEEKYRQFLSSLASLVAARKTYPDWLVAPSNVRQRFSLSLRSNQHSIEDHWILDKLEKVSPITTLAILDLYAWEQDVLLGAINDKCGELGIRILRLTTKEQFETLSEETKATMASLSISSQAELTGCWTRVALAIIKWARQGLLKEQFHTLKSLIAEAYPNDAYAKDTILYEEILLHLYLGERDKAMALLKQWRITSQYVYMLVRKASLVAEVGDSEAALSLCKEAIHRIRDMQRLRPKDLLLLTQEAWACLVAEYIQRGCQYAHWPNNSDDAELDQFGDSLNERLGDIETRGYAPKHELSKVLADLNAEARPPAEAKYKFGEFDLGRSSGVKRIGVTSEFREKIEASFAWLELAERIGIMVRVGRVGFHFADSYIQAAWWAQYADSTQRVHSILFRTMLLDVMKPKDEALPPHKSGWLSRYQVARIDSASAVMMCDRALFQIESILSSTEVDVSRTFDFFAEIFSRLVVRVDSQVPVIDWSKRVLQLHKNNLVQARHDVWGGLSSILGRCLEALPYAAQVTIIGEVAGLPLMNKVNVRSHQRGEWLRLSNMTRWLTSTDDVQSRHEQKNNDNIRWLLEALEGGDDKAEENRAIWERLFLLNLVGALSERDRVSVSEQLWQGNDSWPVMPGFLPHATFIWPAPLGVPPDAAFRKWLLSKHVRPFSDSSSVIITHPKGRRAWGFPTNDILLESWLESIEREEWPVDGIIAGLGQLKAWWDLEGEDIKIDLVIHEELRKALAERVDTIDKILVKFLDCLTRGSSSSANDETIRTVQNLAEEIALSGVSLLRVKIYLAIRQRDFPGVAEMQRNLVSLMLQSNETDTHHAYGIVSWLVKRYAKQELIPLDMVLDACIAVFLARRMTGLIWAIDVLAKTIEFFEEHYWTPSRLQSLCLGLDLLFEELSYEARPVGTGIVDEALPLLRFKCAQLACSLRKSQLPNLEVVQRWLEAAANDPLPEMRFRRFDIASREK